MVTLARSSRSGFINLSAAEGMVEREGVGKVRHVEVDVFRIQEQHARARLPLINADGSRILPDLMINHLANASTF